MTGYILVVDDEAHIRRIVALQFERAGFQVVSAMDGQEALDLTRSEAPELVITDYQMPRLDGVTLCRTLGASTETAGIPVILLTARDFEIDETRLDGFTNVVALLSKPFSPSELLARAKDALACREQR